MIQLLADLSPFLAVGSICLLVGAGMGYFTAHADIERNHHDRPE